MQRENDDYAFDPSYVRKALQFLSRRPFWIGLWMILFGAAGAWIVLNFRWERIRLDTPTALVILGLMMIAGIREIFIAFKAEPNESASPFISALRLLKQRWMLWLIAAFVLLHLLNGLAAYGLFNCYYSHLIMSAYSDQSKSLTISEYFSFKLLPGFASSISGAAQKFLPDLGLDNWEIVTFTGLTLLFLLPWIVLGLRKLAENPKSARQARFARSMLIPITLGAILLLLVEPGYNRHPFPSLASGIWALRSSAFMARILPFAAWPVMQLLVIVPAILGGLTGSLKRASEGMPVNVQTFFGESVRLFRPIAGVYLLVTSAGFLLDIPYLTHLVNGSAMSDWLIKYGSYETIILKLITLLLMLGPFEAAACEHGIFASVGRGIRLFCSTIWRVLGFFALGTTIIVVLRAFESVGLFLIFPNRLSMRIAGPAALTAYTGLHSVFDGFLGVFLAVALWHFYVSIAERSSEA